MSRILWKRTILCGNRLVSIEIQYEGTQVSIIISGV
jgi:hypothetical protein